MRPAQRPAAPGRPQTPDAVPSEPQPTERYGARRSAMAAVEVAAGLIFRAGKLLLTQRPANSHLGGLWEFPGGKRRPQETFEQCLQRELREELGIEVDVGELVEAVTHAYPDRTVHVRFFRCVWRCHEPQPLGCAALAWVGPEELDRYSFPAADARLLDTLRRRADLWQG